MRSTDPRRERVKPGIIQRARSPNMGLPNVGAPRMLQACASAGVIGRDIAHAPMALRGGGLQAGPQSRPGGAKKRLDPTRSSRLVSCRVALVPDRFVALTGRGTSAAPNLWALAFEEPGASRRELNGQSGRDHRKATAYRVTLIPEADSLIALRRRGCGAFWAPVEQISGPQPEL